MRVAFGAGGVAGAAATFARNVFVPLPDFTRIAAEEPESFVAASAANTPDRNVAACFETATRFNARLPTFTDFGRVLAVKALVDVTATSSLIASAVPTNLAEAFTAASVPATTPSPQWRASWKSSLADA